MAEWKPAVIDEYMESLLKRGLFRQAMNERLAKVRGGEEREALARVDSYMTGFLSHEWRKASRKKVSGREGGGQAMSVGILPKRTVCFFLGECWGSAEHDVSTSPGSLHGTHYQGLSPFVPPGIPCNWHRATSATILCGGKSKKFPPAPPPNVIPCVRVAIPAPTSFAGI